MGSAALFPLNPLTVTSSGHGGGNDRATGVSQVGLGLDCRFCREVPLFHRITWVSLLLLACSGGEDTEPEPQDTDLPTEPPIVSTPAMAPLTPTDIAYGERATYTISGLDDRQAYRITLVDGGYVTAPGDGTGTFQDGDANGAADPGASELVALIVGVNDSNYVPGAKTTPSTSDNPANPTGLYPVNGQFTLELEGVGGGTVYPVAYHNGGASTFLEIDAAGAPVEPYAVGGALRVEGPPPEIAPAGPTTLAVDDYVDVTVSGLDDAQAYRVTLVVGDNVTAGPEQSGVFLDLDANGYADAGLSEEIALITQVNGADEAVPAKTVPVATDDPANPSGVYPAAGILTVRVTGVGPGTVRPVAYPNGGVTTFLEVSPDGTPTEPHTVGGALTVE